MAGFFHLEMFTWTEVAIRIALACIFGFVFGFDRSSKNKPIDFRVYMIIAVATCLVGLMGQELYAEYAHADEILHIDLSRLIEGCLTGIGFLGAGAIIKRNETDVIGTATGASIWASGIIGLTLGFGLYMLAFVGFFTIAIILTLFGFLRKPLFHEEEQYDKKKKAK